MTDPGRVMKMAVTVGALGAVGYLIFKSINKKESAAVGGLKNVVTTLKKVSDESSSGMSTASDAVEAFKAGRIGEGVADVTASVMKGAPVGKTLEALNPNNSTGDRAISAGLAYGSVIFPPLNIASWLMPGGDKSSGDYWENLPETSWKGFKDIFDHKSTRADEFHWKPPAVREGLYRELWYQIQKWLDDWKWDPHPEKRYQDFWNDNLTKKVIKNMGTDKGYQWSEADRNFMNKWLDYFLFYNYDKRGKSKDYYKLKDEQKIKDNKTELYRNLQNKYYSWLKDRKNPDAEHSYQKFWQDAGTKKIIDDYNKAAVVWPDLAKTLSQIGNMGSDRNDALVQQVQGWTQNDTQFMNLAFGVQNAEWYWNEKTHGRID